MSSKDPSRDIRRDSQLYDYPPAINKTSRIIDTNSSMSVGYITRAPQQHHQYPYGIARNSVIYSSSQPIMQEQNNMRQQQQPPAHRRQPLGTESYDRPSSATSHPAGPVHSTSSTASSQQTPRITLPPLSAITENSEAQPESTATKPSQPITASPSQPSYPQSQQQPQQSQSQPPQQPNPQSQQQSQHPQSSSPYHPRPSSQYESQQGPYPHSQRHLQPSPQLAPDQSRYGTGSIIPQQAPVQPHQMPVAQLQPNPQMGQFPSPSPTPSHFPAQSQYPFQQPQYSPQPMYGQYPPHQIPPQMPPGIPYQPAYATSHRQRPPQFNPYPPPSASFVAPPQGAPQGWPQQDYIAQPLTPLTSHSPQQPYSPQLQQLPGPGGPMRVRRSSVGLSQPAYPPPPPPPPPPPGEPVQPQTQTQQALKPKRKRATSGQLRVLNSVFSSTFFPSTELRIALGKELNMSPRTVQIWFQNKRQSWRAQRAKMETGGAGGQQSGTPTSSSQTVGSAPYSPHPLRQDQFGSPGHGRMPSSAEDGGREEGMENDEGGGWEALRQAQQANREFRHHSGGPADPEDGFDEVDSPQPRHP